MLPARHALPLVICLINLAITPLAAQDALWNEAKEGALIHFLEAKMAQDNIPGLTIGFLRNEFLWVKGLGYADLENRVPAKDKTSYRFAALTMPMTAMAILKLVEEGKLDLDAEVQTYVPYFPKKSGPVTTRLLLGHLAGISHYRDPARELHIKVPMDSRQAIEIFAEWDLESEPGSTFNYSSYGYNLLGAVIEGASGQPYARYMFEKVWKPLDMSATSLDDWRAIIPNRARGYRFDDGRIQNSEFVDVSSRFSSGGLRGTVADLLKFAKATWTDQVLNPGSRAQMLRSLRIKDGRETGYAMGWVVNSSKNGHFRAMHRGAAEETHVMLWVFPSEKLALAVALNFEGGQPDAYLGRLHELLSGEVTRTYFSKDEKNRLTLLAMVLAFEQGLSYFNLHGQPMSTDPADLRRAFEFFKPLGQAAGGTGTAAEIRRHLEQLGDAAHRDDLAIMGSHIAALLAQSGDATPINSYHKYGPVVFFRDYAELSKQFPPDDPTRFDQPQIEVFNEWVKALFKPGTILDSAYPLPGGLNLEHMVNTVVPAFEEEPVFYDYSDIIQTYAIDLGNAGKLSEGIGFIETAIKLYPDRAGLYGSLAQFQAANGEPAKAVEACRKALAIDPNYTQVKALLDSLIKRANR